MHDKEDNNNKKKTKQNKGQINDFVQSISASSFGADETHSPKQNASQLSKAFLKNRSFKAAFYGGATAVAESHI